MSTRLTIAIGLSIIVHAAVLFGVAFKVPLTSIDMADQPMEVVLVNSHASSQPVEPDAPVPARATHVDGKNASGATHRSGSAVPVDSGERDAMGTPPVAGEIQQPEPEAQEPMELMEGGLEQGISQMEALFRDPETPGNSGGKDAMGLVQRSLEIARSQARVVRNVAYQKSPKRKFIGARTQDYRFARYVEDWRLKVERIGNLNYPEAAKRDQLYGSLQLTVGINSDGSLESIDINRPSGKRVLDEAAIRIVKLAGQNGFAPFPSEIGRDVDVLHITRTWAFTRADELTSE